MLDLSNENIVHIRKDRLEYIMFKRLLEYKNIIHCYTLKPIDFGSNSTYELRKKEIQKDLKRLSEELKFDTENIYRPKQTHTDIVEVAEDGFEGIFNERYNNVDGLVTNEENKILVLGFADCTPLFFYDPIKNVIANIHSGWKGTYQKIALRAVEKMKEKYSCNPKDLICCIGPHIRKCHFEVDQDVRDMFFEKFKELDSINDIITKDESKQKYYIDTLKINTEILKMAGLKEENIIDSKICTVCNSTICHSYRADKELAGRSISVIGRRK